MNGNLGIELIFIANDHGLTESKRVGRPRRHSGVSVHPSVHGVVSKTLLKLNNRYFVALDWKSTPIADFGLLSIRIIIRIKLAEILDFVVPGSNAF